ncbi:MAG TPA: hypothetical protein VN763_07850, partial [Saprospiraceae bacterium]|nr:hypothetical protein [Saprospiraceae bacterium]
TFAAGAFTHFVAGNWTNNGGTFTNTGSTIYFMNILANQQINGSAATQAFNNLTIAKSSRKLIIAGSTTTATVVGTLTMISGNIDCGINTLQLGTSTATVGTLSYTAGNIIGKFTRWFNTTGPKTFPLGTNSGSGTSTANRNVLITFTQLTGGSLTGNFIATNPGSTGLPLVENSYSLINQFTEGYWSLVAASSLASTNYNLELTGQGFISYGQDAEVRIIKRSVGGAWTLNGTHAPMVGATAKRTTLTGVSGEFAHVTKCGGTNAGPDQTAYNTSVFIMAATLSSGTGAWTIESGSATIVAPTSPTTTITGVPFGTSVTLKWTQTTGSCASFDFVTVTNSSSHNTDLPNPDPNIVNAPAGTIVIPMDSLNYAPTYFNIKTYGLIVKLLNAKIGVRWIINSSKVHNGIDFTGNAKKILPTSGSTALRNFKGGPFLIYPQDTAGVRAIINAFNAGLTNKVNVYQLTSAVNVDERYRLTQRPKVAILNN